MPAERNIVVRRISRTPPDILEGLARAGVATVHEASGRQGYLGPDIRPIQQGVTVAGSAVTVLSHPDDNMMIHASVEVCRPGDLLVVATTSPSTYGMFGDLLATSLQHRGVAGLVIDAGVRDTADLRLMGFPVWSRHVSCQGTEKSTAGSVNVRVSIGGVSIEPGDAVCADDDGVVVVRRVDAPSISELAAARLVKESETRARLERGELGLDFYGLRDRLIGLGVEFVDEPEP